MGIQRWHANVKWFRVWTEALPEKMIKDLNNIPARPFFEHAQELNLNGVSDRVDVSDDFNTLQGGEMTFAFRATQKSIERNYERAWDWSRSCGYQSAHVFADVYTSLHMTFQVYGLGHVAVDNFWELGVEHVYAFVVSNTHMKVYRDGIEMGARAVNGGIGHGVRDMLPRSKKHKAQLQEAKLRSLRPQGPYTALQLAITTLWEVLGKKREAINTRFQSCSADNSSNAVRNCWKSAVASAWRLRFWGRSG